MLNIKNSQEGASAPFLFVIFPTLIIFSKLLKNTPINLDGLTGVLKNRVQGKDGARVLFNIHIYYEASKMKQVPPPHL